jgi:hypothetical protein
MKNVWNVIFGMQTNKQFRDVGYYTRVKPLVWKPHHQCLCNHPICWDGSKTYLKPTKQMCAVWAWSLFSDFISSWFLSLKIVLIFHSCFIESLASCWTKLLGGFNPSEKYLSNGIIVPNIWKNKTHVSNHQAAINGWELGVPRWIGNLHIRNPWKSPTSYITHWSKVAFPMIRCLAQPPPEETGRCKARLGAPPRQRARRRLSSALALVNSMDMWKPMGYSWSM